MAVGYVYMGVLFFFLPFSRNYITCLYLKKTLECGYDSFCLVSA